jgi:hypothetical protein
MNDYSTTFVVAQTPNEVVEAVNALNDAVLRYAALSGGQMRGVR